MSEQMTNPAADYATGRASNNRTIPAGTPEPFGFGEDVEGMAVWDGTRWNGFPNMTVVAGDAYRLFADLWQTYHDEYATSPDPLEWPEQRADLIGRVNSDGSLDLTFGYVTWREED